MWLKLRKVGPVAPKIYSQNRVPEKHLNLKKYARASLLLTPGVLYSSLFWNEIHLKQMLQDLSYRLYISTNHYQYTKYNFESFPHFITLSQNKS